MREFFKGWRRKAGCCLLVMAFCLGLLWWRSCMLADLIEFPLWDRQIQIDSWQQSITFRTGPFESHWWCKSATPFNGRDLLVESDWFSVEIARLAAEEFDEVRVPYMPIVMPLTLLAALLILWKPTKKPQDHSSSSAPIPNP